MDFHETWWEDVVWGHERTFRADLDQGADPGIPPPPHPPLSSTLPETAFLNIFVDFLENNSWNLMKKVFMSVCNLVQIQMKIWIW